MITEKDLIHHAQQFDIPTTIIEIVCTGRGDWDGEYMYIHGWFMSMYDKNHYNIVK